MDDPAPLLALTVGVGLLVVIVLLRGQSSQIRTRLKADDDDPQSGAPRPTDPEGWLSSWLFLAGYRSPNAANTFLIITLGLLLVSGFTMYRITTSGAVDQLVAMLSSIPGGVGNVIVPFALASPWFIVATISGIPALLVRAVRRNRVSQVEEDLPLVLDLLNTLAQAGIGFDAALDRVLAAQSPNRPLVQELRSFQYDILAGRPRVDSLRALSRRVEVPTFSSFISAIIQAEQVGAGIAQTLRIQADDFRARRRERATAAALAVPTKLIVPMVIGFLPGVFVALLGPMMHEAFQMMDRTLRGIGGGG